MAENSTWFATDVATLGDLQRLRALKALLRWQAA